MINLGLTITVIIPFRQATPQLLSNQPHSLIEDMDGIGIPAFIGAGFVGWSRIESKQHDWIDVTAGGALGILCGYYFTQPLEDVLISPMVKDGLYGVKITMSW